MNNVIATYLSISFIIAVSMISMQCFCIINSISVYSGGQKTVCLIGEIHNSTFTMQELGAPKEIRDRDYIFDLVRSAAQNSEPVIFILEASDYQESFFAQQLQQNANFELGALGAIAAYAQKNNNKIGNVQFIFADRREIPLFIPFTCTRPYTTSNLPYSILPYLTAAAKQLQIQIPDKKLSPEGIDQELIKNPTLRQELFAPESKFAKYFSGIKKDGIDCPPEVLINDLKNRLRQLKKREKTLGKRSPLFKFLKSNEKQLKQIIEDATHFFKSITGNEITTVKKSVADCIHDAIVERLFTFIIREYYQWMMPLFCITADINFAIALADALAQANKVIFFGGCLHREMIQEILSSDSSFKKLVSSENGLKTIVNDIASSLWSDETINRTYGKSQKSLGFHL